MEKNMQYYMNEAQTDLSSNLRSTLNILFEEMPATMFYTDAPDDSNNLYTLNLDAYSDRIWYMQGIKQVIVSKKGDYIKVLRKEGKYFIVELIQGKDFCARHGNNKEDFHIDFQYYSPSEEEIDDLLVAFDSDNSFNPDSFFKEKEIKPQYVGSISSLDKNQIPTANLTKKAPWKIQHQEMVDEIPRSTASFYPVSSPISRFYSVYREYTKKLDIPNIIESKDKADDKRLTKAI